MVETNSNQTRATSVASTGDLDALDFPVAYYKPLRVGTVGRKTRVEEVLEQVRVSFEDYIWYTDIIKVILNLHSSDFYKNLQREKVHPCHG